MPVVKIDKTIFRRVRSHGSLSKALDEFVDAVSRPSTDPATHPNGAFGRNAKRPLIGSIVQANQRTDRATNLKAAAREI